MVISQWANGNKSFSFWLRKYRSNLHSLLYVLSLEMALCGENWLGITHLLEEMNKGCCFCRWSHKCISNGTQFYVMQ